MPNEILPDGTTMTVIDTPFGIQTARMLTLRAGLKLECKGMTRHGRSCYSIVKLEFGLKGNKVKVLELFSAMISKRMYERNGQA